jgi:hypothetical protein
MRFVALSAVLLASLCITATVTAQCATTAAPGLENFDALIPQASTVISPASTSSPDPLPTGWTHDLVNSTNLWRPFAGPSPSYAGNSPAGQTGPPGDHTIGGTTGVYLFTESSGTSPGDAAIVEVCFDLSAVAFPVMSFWYHMNGSTTGSLVLEQSTDGGLTWPTQLFSASGDHGDVWLVATNIVLTPDSNSQAHLRFAGTPGGSWRRDTAIDDVDVSSPTYATNDGDGSLDVDGVTGTGSAPAIVNMLTTPCGGTTARLSASTQNVGSLYEVAISDQNLSAPGVALLGDLLNLSIFSNITYLNGGSGLKFLAMPAGPPPFTGSSGWYLDFTAVSTFDLSIQGVFTTPNTASGIAFSQGTELHCTSSSAVAPFPGPNFVDDSGVLVDLTDPATCISPAGVTFGGTIFTEVSVESNGRIVFGMTDSYYGPTVGHTLTLAPSFGFWSDLTPNNGITISKPAPGVLRADYVNVYYFGQPTPLLSFSLEMDTVNQTYTIDNLLGIAANPSPGYLGSEIWMGISLGNVGPATDPGATIFTAGGAGSTVLPTDSLYDFYDGMTPAGLPASMLPATLNNITFAAFPGGFAWSGS